MSSILKALRRLEEERARKSSVAPEIAASLLRHSPHRSSAPRWIWPAAFSTVGLLLAASLWFWRPEAPLPQLVTPILPASLPATTSSERGREVIIEEVIDQRKPVLLRPATPSNTLKTFPSAKGGLPAVTVASESLPLAQSNKTIPTVMEERQSPVVTAIVWQDDSAKRMAVVE